MTQALIARGLAPAEVARTRGYLTRGEFDQMFPPDLSPDCAEALKRELWKLHISILVTGDKR